MAVQSREINAGNGGKPSGVLSFGQPLKPETKDKLRQTWQARFGSNGEGGIAILDGDAKFQTMTMTSVDAQYIETRRMQIEEIARVFRVQPIMMMQADKAATFASGTLLLEAEDKPVLPAKLEVLDDHRAYLTLTEGRYHQVRRMFAAVGNHVNALHRDRIGALDLPSDLEPGHYRVIDVEGLAPIFAGDRI